MDYRELNNETLQKVKERILNEGRKLDAEALKLEFGNTDKHDYIKELILFQNDDGGFGNGIEPDFIFPSSSPMATSIGLKYLEKIDETIKGREMIKRAVEYLEKEYNYEEKRWYSAGKSLNDFPHAPWWNIDEETGRNCIDASWGNPTAELAGYLYKYREYTVKIDAKKLVAEAVRRLEEKKQFTSEHEIYCYIRMYNRVPEEFKKRMKEPITRAIEGLISTDPKEWDQYTPNPLRFIEKESKEYFGISMNLINKSLDYVINKMETEGEIKVNWEWGQYEDEWNIQKRNWIGIINLNYLVILKKFNRLRGD